MSGVLTPMDAFRLRSIMPYSERMNELWARHQAPREDGAPTVISTFAGGGGSSLGYSAAGYRELLAVEFDDHAVKTFKTNFPEVDVYPDDISDLTVDQVLERTGLKVGELDVLDGSPPCQGFSTAGHRKTDDARNLLFLQFTRLLAGLQPRAFVMENVTGMLAGKMRPIFVEIVKELQGCGYDIAVKVMMASNYGVPQNRRRVIFIGVRKDLKILPSHPNDDGTVRVNAMQALENLELHTDEVYELPEKMRAVWSMVAVGRSQKELTFGGSHFGNCVKLNPLRPAPTLLKLATDRGFGTMVHWDEPRCVAIPEAQRLQSFPDQYRIEGKYQERWARIGNSVPPLLMYAVAQHLREAVLCSDG